MIDVFPKNFETREIEPKWQQFWAENHINDYDPNSSKPIYSIDTPPPTVSGSLHIGHIFSYTHTEIQARYMRMRGYNVYYPMGYDDNGLPSERLTEKVLDIKATDLPRPEFIKKCLEVCGRFEEEFENLWKMLGMSIDWSLTYTTIEDRSRRISQRSFLDLLKKDRIYRNEGPMIWCPQCQTAIAQAEIKSRKTASKFNDIKFVLEDGSPLWIATTRPELLPSCVAVFAHPDDSRYKHLIGKKARVPVFDHMVEIKADEKADPEKGTGIVMCCTFGDNTDMEWWKKHSLDLRLSINPDGKMNRLAGRFEGLPIKAARKAILEEMKAKDLLGKQPDIEHDVQTHERCDTELEFLSTRQWFVRVLDIKDELIRLADQINWFPDFMKTRYTIWVENLNWDWCISRQRFYGVPFPVWYCNDCGAMLLPDDSRLPVDPLTEAYGKSCDKCGGNNIQGETDVMDTWATSGLTPNINARWRENDERNGIYPMSLRPQAHEIIRTWTFYTITKSWLHDRSIPWKNVAISGFVTVPKSKDEKTEKLSKSKPGQKQFKSEKISKSKHDTKSTLAMVEKYGADCIRYWASNAPLGSDMPIEMKPASVPGQAPDVEDFKIGRRTLTKLWNSMRFLNMNIEGYKHGEKPALQPVDCWLIRTLNEKIRSATGYFDGYDFRTARLEIGEFFWSAFCDNYLEIVKDRIYNFERRGAESKRAAQWTLWSAGLAVLKMYSPFIPHLTEELYSRIFKTQDGLLSIHKADWPAPVELSNSELDGAEAGRAMVETLAACRKYKGDRKMKTRDAISRIVVACHPSRKQLFESVEQDIRAACVTSEIVYENIASTRQAIVRINDYEQIVAFT